MFKLHSVLVPAMAVTLVACGARFSAHENDGTAGGYGGEASGGSASAGNPAIGDAGEQDTGGTGASGAGSTGGAVTGTAGATTGAAGSTGGRGSWGSGGWGNGGWWSGNGGATAADCATLRQDYQAAVEKARACDKGSTDQCSPSSTAETVGGCGCPVLINTKSEAASAAKAAYQAYVDGGCEHGGPVCNIFCGAAEIVSCQASASTGTFVCTASGLQK